MLLSHLQRKMCVYMVLPLFVVANTLVDDIKIWTSITLTWKIANVASIVVD